MTERLYLGIDGGGTSCRARIRNADGDCLGEGSAGSANPRVGLEAAFASIIDAARQALESAGLDEGHLGRLHAGLGLAGVNLTLERDRVLAYPHPFADVVLETDVYVACLGAHRGSDGAVLIAGTGSNAIALQGDRQHTVGGWGFLVADQGSGAGIGRAAVRRALWAHEGMVETTLFSRQLLAQFSNEPERLVIWADQALPRDYGAFVPLVFEHAEKGDSMATMLLRQAAEDLALMIQALLSTGVSQVCLMGGLARPITPWLPPSVQTVLVPAKGDAMDGAILLARRQLEGTRP